MSRWRITLVWLAFGAPVLADELPLTLGVLSFRPTAVAQAQWQPLERYLNQTIKGRHFVLKVFGFDALQEAVRQRTVDIVITQPAEYVRMVHQNGLSSPLATIINLEEGKPVRAFGGVILVSSHRGDLNSLKDLDGKRIATASRVSFGTYLIQAYELALAGVNPGGYVEIGLPQDLVVGALLERKADAAFVRTGMLETLLREGKLLANQVRVLNPQEYPGYPLALSTRLYPEWPVVAMPHVPDDVTVQIAGALLSLPHGSAKARSMGVYGFAVPADYEPVRALMRELRAPPFDHAPTMTFLDVWQQYRWPILLLALALAAMLLMAVREMFLRQRLTSFGDAMGEGMYVLNRRGRATYVNRTACELLGYPREVLLGKELLQYIVSPVSTPQSIKGLNPMIDPDRWNQSFEGENRFVHASGRHFPVAVSCQAVTRKGKFLHTVTVFSDISERKAQSERIYKLAYHDQVTGLPNRRFLLDRLQQTLSSRKSTTQPGALLFCDLDRFKQLNDSLGHRFGDALLRAVAQRMSGLSVAGSTVVHTGGDEFAIMLGRLDANPDVAMNLASVQAEKIRVAMQEPFEIDGQHHKISVSIGVVMIDGQEQIPEELLKRADIAMYQAKESGRNAIRFFDRQIETQLNYKVELEADLHQALEKKQFIVHYQPQVDTLGRVMGMEALVRWQHPRRGLVLPGQFIGLAEESGLILPLGRWVLEQACEQIRRWREHPATAHLVVSVNLCAHQIFQSNFVETVTNTLRSHDTDPKNLQLELTESVLAKNIEDVIDKMRRLVELGTTFSLDDFGTGYSSLNYLKRLPLQQLKIDASFVRDLVTDPNDASITQTIITLGNSLDLEVIAEGVEQRVQRDLLARQGCRFFQGYYFGRPQTATTWTEWLKSDHTLPAALQA